MIELHTWSTPNGRKPAIALEELGLPYTVHPVDITKDVQHSPDFLKLNPNNKIPALVDRRGTGAPVVVFESGAILIHLAETSAGGNRLLPSSTSPAERAEVLQWLMWQMAGLGPMMGKAGSYANEGDKRAHAGAAADDFIAEVDRLWGVLDAQLERTKQFIAGAGYSIADIACFPWMAAAWGPHKNPRYSAVLKRRPELMRFTNIPRWVDLVGQRAAVQKGMAILTQKA